MDASEKVAGRGRQPQLVADEVIEYSAGVAADGAVRLVRNHQVEIRGRKLRLVLVVEQQRLNGGHHDVCPPPVVAFFLVDDRVEVGRQVRNEGLARRLVFQLQPIDQEEDAAGVASAEEQLDDGRGHQRLAGAGRHLEQEPVAPVADSLLQTMNRLYLIVAQKAQPVRLDVAGSLGLVAPPGLGRIVGPLREGDVVGTNLFIDQTLRVGNDLVVSLHRVRRWKRGDDMRVAAL